MYELSYDAGFFLPQGSNISGKNGRIHCSLNINTETGRLSARRPNLQVPFVSLHFSYNQLTPKKQRAHILTIDVLK